jgi:uncharacterized coiled-coil protein SlyX
MRNVFRKKLYINIIIMSSARSNAAARQRRAGEPPTNNQVRQGPNQSIASASAFQQSSFNRNTGVNSQDKSLKIAPKNKISVSDAIGLLSLRLGKLEMQFAEQDETISSSNLPDNTIVVDNSVLNNIVSRIDSIEKKDSNMLITKLTNEFRDIKDMLLLQNIKFEKYIVVNDKRLEEIENRFIEFENVLNKKIVSYETDINKLNDNEDDNEAENMENDEINVSMDLKSTIECELNNSI